MRCGKFGFVLLALLVALCIVELSCLSAIVSDAQTHLESAQRCAADGRYADAVDAAGQACSLWGRHRLFLGAVLRHEDSDALYFLFARLPYFAQDEDGAELRATCGELSERLRHILDSERPRLYNIF